MDVAMIAKRFLAASNVAGIFFFTMMNAAADAPRDGSHDFDFAKGVWHTHATQVLDPFDGGTHSVTLEGTKTALSIWNGRAWLEEIEAEGPKGHWEGATLFVYNPKSGQWSQTYIDGSGDADTPTIGSFRDGRGELFGTTSYKGSAVLMRGVWSDITQDSHRYEIAYSRDGGHSWATAFKAQLTRVK
jgi:hypothetical protein